MLEDPSSFRSLVNIPIVPAIIVQSATDGESLTIAAPGFACHMSLDGFIANDMFYRIAI